MNGVAVKQDFSIIKNNPNQQSSIVTSTLAKDCYFCIDFLAEIGSITDDLKNDKTSFIWFLDNNFVSAELILQVYLNGTWSDLADLNDDTYGIFFEYGYGGKTLYQEDRIGYLLDFNKVINEASKGHYRVKCVATTILATEVIYYSDYEFNVKEYKDFRADNTVRLDWYKNGNEGRLKDVTLKNDYGSINWYNSIRLPNSFFGQVKDTKEKTFVKYQNGNQVWLSDSIDLEYNLKLTAVEFWLINLISLDFNTNSEMYITDYNTTNQMSIIKLPITSTSGANITYNDASMLVSADYTYKPLINNFIHKRG